MILSILLFETKLFKLIKNSFSVERSLSFCEILSTNLSSFEEVEGPCDK